MTGQKAAPPPEDPAPGAQAIQPQSKRPGKMGRPTTYNPEVGERICTRLYHPTFRFLQDVVQDDDIKVTLSKFFRWLQTHHELREMYAFAREQQADGIARQVVALPAMAFSGPEFLEMLKLAADTPGAVMHARVNQVRLMVDSLKWMASKISKRYAKGMEELLADAVNRGAGNLDDAIAAMAKLDEQQAARIYIDAVKVGA